MDNLNIIQFWTGIQDVSWIPVLNNTINLGSQYKIVPTEGYISWEYNPLRNYRLNENMYEKDGKYYTKQELKDILTSIGTKQFFYNKVLRIYHPPIKNNQFVLNINDVQTNNHTLNHLQ